MSNKTDQLPLVEMAVNFEKTETTSKAAAKTIICFNLHCNVYLIIPHLQLGARFCPDQTKFA